MRAFAGRACSALNWRHGLRSNICKRACAFRLSGAIAPLSVAMALSLTPVSSRITVGISALWRGIMRENANREGATAFAGTQLVQNSVSISTS